MYKRENLERRGRERSFRAPEGQTRERRSDRLTKRSVRHHQHRQLQCSRPCTHLSVYTLLISHTETLLAQHPALLSDSPDERDKRQKAGRTILQSRRPIKFNFQHAFLTYPRPRPTCPRRLADPTPPHIHTIFLFIRMAATRHHPDGLHRVWTRPAGPINTVERGQAGPLR